MRLPRVGSPPTPGDTVPHHPIGSRRETGYALEGGLETSALWAAAASVFIVTVGMAADFIGPSEAASFGVGGTLALTILASRSRGVQDPLYPARLQLARLRRSGKAADILVVRGPTAAGVRRKSASRKSARTASSVLRMSDGVSVIPSPREYGVCAVIDIDARARAAIEHRLRNACGADLRLGWASSPDDGLTLESLVTAAMNRVPDQRPRQRERTGMRLRVGRPLQRSLGPSRGPVRRAR
jgi:hypothetical protein